MNIPPKWKIIHTSKNIKDPIRATCRAPNGKIQYIYHPLWISLSKLLKFKKLLKMCKKIKDFKLEKKKDVKDDMIQNMIDLVFKTCIRIGNEETGTLLSEHVGLVSLTHKHLHFKNKKVFLIFIGKSGIKHNIEVNDKNNIKFLTKCYKNKGDIYLFKYQCPSKGKSVRITSNDVNNYIKDLWGKEYSCKDIRTYQANIQLIKELMTLKDRSHKKNIKNATESSAELLGHSVSICKKNYLCEHINKLYMDNPKKFTSGKKPVNILYFCIKDYLKS